MDSEYDGNSKNPGNSIEIQGIRWKSWESIGNPENPGSTKSAVFALANYRFIFLDPGTLLSNFIENDYLSKIGFL
jgi:hypothetical protein